MQHETLARGPSRARQAKMAIPISATEIAFRGISLMTRAGIKIKLFSEHRPSSDLLYSKPETRAAPNGVPCARGAIAIAPIRIVYFGNIFHFTHFRFDLIEFCAFQGEPRTPFHHGHIGSRPRAFEFLRWDYF